MWPTQLERIDSVLTLDSLSEPVNPKMPEDSSIELSHVCFSYDFEKNNSISSELNRNFPSSEGVTSETSLSSSGVSQIETGKDKENISSSQTENEEEISAVIDGDVIKDVSLRIEPGQIGCFLSGRPEEINLLWRVLLPDFLTREAEALKSAE